MTFLDWLIVVVANGLIVGYGLYLARGTKDSYEWFLAAKGLPWWIVGLSMFATAVDSGDYVAVVGGAYTFGLSNLTTWWLGIPIGWFIVSYVVFLPLYRSGMFTNAEYLEYRFGPGVGVMGALIQIQYRRKKGTASRFPHSTGIEKKQFGERKSVAVPHFRPNTLLPRAVRRDFAAAPRRQSPGRRS